MSQRIHCDRCEKEMPSDVLGLAYSVGTDKNHLCLNCLRAFAAFMAMALLLEKRQDYPIEKWFWKIGLDFIDSVAKDAKQQGSHRGESESVRQRKAAIQDYCAALKLKFVKDLFPKIPPPKKGGKSSKKAPAGKKAPKGQAPLIHS